MKSGRRRKADQSAPLSVIDRTAALQKEITAAQGVKLWDQTDRKANSNSLIWKGLHCPIDPQLGEAAPKWTWSQETVLGRSDLRHVSYGPSF